jgi:hypothetical protein
MTVNPNYPVIAERWGPLWTAAGAAVPSDRWVNLVDRTLTSVSAKRGKQYELDTAQAGEYQTTLGSPDGALDPTNTGGPYAGHILPYQPYQRRAQWPPTQNLLDYVIATGGEGYTAGAIPASIGVKSTADSTGGVIAQPVSPLTAWQGTNTFRFNVPSGILSATRVCYTDRVAVRPGQTYTVQLLVRNITDSTSISVQSMIAFYGSTLGATPVTWNYGTPTTLTGSSTANTWTRIALTVTAPTSVYGMSVGFSTGATVAATCTVEVDAWQVEAAGSPSTWTAPGTWYPLFTGYTERWPTQWLEGGTYGQVSPTGVDAFALLSQVKLGEVFAEEVESYSPRFVYTLSDAAGASSAADSTGANKGAGITYAKGGNGNTTFGNAQTSVSSTGGYIGSSETVVSMRPGASGVNASSPAAMVDLNSAGIKGPVDSGNGFTRMIAFRYAGGSIPTDGAYIWHSFYTNTPNSPSAWLTAGVALYIGGSDGKLRASFNTIGQTATIVLNSNVVVTDQNWHLVSVAVSGTTATLVLDGAVVATGTINVLSLGGWWDVLGAFWTASTRTAVMTFYGDLAYATEFPQALTTAQMSQLYFAWKTACTGESSDARYGRILRYAGFTGASNIGIGLTTSVGPATNIVGTDALSALNDVVTTENGNHFVGADGSITFQSRGIRYNSLTPVYTFGDGPGEYPYEELQLDFDSTHLSNVVTVTQKSTGTTFVGQNNASIASYFTRTMTRDNNSTNVGECQDSANYLVSRYSQPLTRVQAVKFHPSANTSLWPVLLGLELGTRVRINRRPFGAPEVTVDCFVEQIQWDMDDKGEAWCTLQCSPIDPTPYGQFSDTLPQFDQAVFAY